MGDRESEAKMEDVWAKNAGRIRKWSRPIQQVWAGEHGQVVLNEELERNEEALERYKKARKERNG